MQAQPTESKYKNKPAGLIRDLERYINALKQQPDLSANMTIAINAGELRLRQARGRDWKGSAPNVIKSNLDLMQGALNTLKKELSKARMAK